jgi:drug/metabolite transporter (DMT)-like permease
VIAFAIALAASTAWGVSDFLAGLKSRTTSLLIVPLASQGAGLLVLLPAVAGSGAPLPGLEFVALGLVAGLANVAALAAFYRGMALGPMGIVAPITACDVILPVAFGVARGGTPSLLQGAGMTLAIGGIVLACAGGDERKTSRALRGCVGLALLAAVCFGLFTVTIDGASEGGVLWAVLISRWATVTALLAVALVHFRGLPKGSGQGLPMIFAIGLTDVLATGLFALATTHGLLSYVGVYGSLYPIVTIVLARVLLREQLDRLQATGAAGALAGAALLAAVA